MKCASSISIVAFTIRVLLRIKETSWPGPQYVSVLKSPSSIMRLMYVSELSKREKKFLKVHENLESINSRSIQSPWLALSTFNV